MAKIKKYIKKDGSTAYMFNTYVGIDPKTGKTKRTTRRGFKTQKEAKLALARIEVGEDQPQTKTEKLTYEAVYKRWFKNYKETVTEYTAQGAETFFRCHILPLLGDKIIDKITYDDCQSAVITWHKKLQQFYTIKGYASRVFKYARKNKWVSENPFDDVDMPKKHAKKKKESDQFYTKNELNAFLAWAHENLSTSDITAFRVLSFTGLRKGELRALTWSDIDLKSMSIDINKAVKGSEKIGPTKNDASTRVIGIDEETTAILKRWRLEQRKDFLKRGISINRSQFVFTDEENKTFMYRDHLRDMMKKYPEKQIDIHGFRHTHATLLLDAGVNYKDVQARLGHKSADMTMNVYAHPIQNDQQITAKFTQYLNTI